tara:strand:+ start:352 stop:462 length:111 start_codon:yes stop_codon:yes gene_type:complete
VAVVEQVEIDQVVLVVQVAVEQVEIVNLEDQVINLL